MAARQVQKRTASSKAKAKRRHSSWRLLDKKALMAVVFATAFSVVGVSMLLGSRAEPTSGPIKGIAGKCLDNYAQHAVNGNKIELWTCDDSIAQRWRLRDGAIINENGFCLDVQGGRTIKGTLVQLYTCNGTGAQQWAVNKENGTITNPKSGLCLDDQYAKTHDGNQIWIWPCNGTAAQKWTFPMEDATPNIKPPIGLSSDWRLAFNDEFNGRAVDDSKWNLLDKSNFGSTNSDDACYMAKNVATSNGTLKLTAQRQAVQCGGGNPDGGGKSYHFTSGQITTRAQNGPMKYKFKQGYIEARIKAPKGNPYWTAFWLTGPGDGSAPGWPDYGEADITEIVGVRPDATFGTFHYKCADKDGHCSTSPTLYNVTAKSPYGGTNNLGAQLTSKSIYDNYKGGTTDFHIYGFLWEANKISWYVDGRKVRFFDGQNLYRIEQNGSQTLEKTIKQMGDPSIPFKTIFGYPHSIILGLGLGGNYPKSQGYTGKGTATGYSNGNFMADLPSSMEVDYLRIWQP